jgi:hypothetical protein
MWVTKSYHEVFGEKGGKEPYKMVGHSMQFNKRIGKQVCALCGLVGLRNEFTDWSIRVGCMSSDHPQYESVRKRTSQTNVL